MVMKNKIYILYIILITIVFLLCSLFYSIYDKVYFYSSDITHWVNLATIFSGFVGTILTFSTVIILVLTLRETQKNSIENIKSLHRDADNKKLEIINLCCDTFNLFLDKEHIAFVNNENAYFDTLSHDIMINVNQSVIDKKIKIKYELIKECINKSKIYRYDDVKTNLYFFINALKNISLINDVNLKDIATSILKNKISKDRIFWTICLMLANDNKEINIYLKLIPNIYIIPEKLHHNMMMNTLYAD